MNSLTKYLDKVDWDFPNSERGNGIHNIHPYPAKFIPEIPRALINIVGAPTGTCILDPFCGSGATLIESQLAGYSAIGIDINPIACLISKVKTHPLPEEFIEIALDVIKASRYRKVKVDIPPIPRIDHWFNPEIQEVITRLLNNINKVKR